MGYFYNYHGSSYQTCIFAYHDLEIISLSLVPVHFISAPQNTCGCDSEEVMLTVSKSCIFKRYAS